MDLQLTTASLPYYPLGSCLALARQLGFDSVELALTPRLLRQGGERASQLSAAHNAPVRSLSVPPGLATTDAVEAVARFAAALPACRLLVVPAPSGAQGTGSLGRFVALIQQYLVALAGQGVALSIENAVPAPPGGPAGPLDRFPQLRRLVEEWDLSFTFDTSHAAGHGWVITEPVLLMGSRLRNVHLSDYRLPHAAGQVDLLNGAADGRPALHQLPGQGILPLRAFLRALCRREYRGLVTLDLQPRTLRAWWPPTARQRLAGALAFCQAFTHDGWPRGITVFETPSETPAEAENES